MLPGSILISNKNRAMTLMELLVAMALLTMIVLGIMNIEIFCKHAFTGTDRKTKVSNEATYIIEHMSKFIGKAIGSAGDFPVTDSNIPGCDKVLRAWTEVTPTGVKDTGDVEIAYCYESTDHTLDYFPHYRTWPDTINTDDDTKERMSRNIVTFDTIFGPNMNYVDITIEACWNATVSCGSVDNPRVKMQTRVVLPSVSINTP